MLIGTAILTAIDHLINLGKFHDDGEIRNIGFIIGLLLQFALYFKEACCAYEDRWQVVVVKKADEHGVTIRSLNGIGLLLDKIRSKTVIIKSEEESANFEDNDPGKLNERPNFIRAYEPAPYSQAGVGRSWDSWDWKQEVYLAFMQVALCMLWTDFCNSSPHTRSRAALMVRLAAIAMI